MGHLIVFEGQDGVGKTTLARMLTSELDAPGHSCLYKSFPGNEPGSLGRLVYDIHHDPQSFGVTSLNPTSLQLLHVAAHIDAINRDIKPLLRTGAHIILDRYWWSTIAYGMVAGSDQLSLDQMVSIERYHWGDIHPLVVFLIARHELLEDAGLSATLVSAYESLATREQATQRISRISTDCSVDESAAAISRTVRTLMGIS